MCIPYTAFVHNTNTQRIKFTFIYAIYVSLSLHAIVATAAAHGMSVGPSPEIDPIGCYGCFVRRMGLQNVRVEAHTMNVLCGGLGSECGEAGVRDHCMSLWAHTHTHRACACLSDLNGFLARAHERTPIHTAIATKWCPNMDAEKSSLVKHLNSFSDTEMILFKGKLLKIKCYRIADPLK